MCGICGFTGVPDQSALRMMNSKMIHRGPDEDGYFEDNEISFAMRRLSIIDLETGKQPVHNENNTIWAVFNGEIYNYKDLRNDLIKKDHRFYTDHADSEIIVHAYEEYGIDFIKYLNGMFAIALWDSAKRFLFLVRDRMGVKPLYYIYTNNRLIFGSEIKSILCHPSVKKNPCFSALYHYLSFKHIPSPYTAFEGIFSLPHGSYLHYTNSKYTINDWWKLNYSSNVNSHFNLEEAQHTILNILDDATKIRMQCDVPYGAYLSGGIDSSTIVALMSKHVNQPIKTFCLGYEDSLANKDADLYYARKISKLYKTDHYEYIISSKDVIDNIDYVIQAFDQPFSGTISTFFLTNLISKHVKVALSGDGADEIFGSYLSHRLSQPISHYRRLMMSHDKLNLNDDQLKELFSPFEVSYLNDLYKTTNGLDVSWRHKLCVFTDEEKRELLRNIQQINGIKTTYELLSEYFAVLSSTDPLNRILEMEWNTFFPDQVLAFVDHLSMASSVEVRSPFIDFRLVEYVAKIPGDYKIHNGIVKKLLKDSLLNVIPHEIIQRPKEGFVLPVFYWLTNQLSYICYDILSESNLNSHKLFNNRYVSQLLNDFSNGNLNLASKVWNLMMFQVWWNNYIR